MNSQLKKGVLETCVLAILSKTDMYGYELVENISRYVEITEGTIYPLLRRLKDLGLVDTYLKESQSGPPRKYYRITESGKEEAKKQVEEYFGFVRNISELIGENYDKA